MTKRYAFDIETRSKADLRLCGGPRYSLDPSTEILCAVWVDLDTGYRTVWVNLVTELPPRREKDDNTRYIYGYSLAARKTIRELAKDAVWIAHNGEAFDRWVWENFHLTSPAEFQPAEWLDSMYPAARANLPLGLDNLAKFLFGLEKDKAGHRMMLKFAKPRKTSKGAQFLPWLAGNCWPTVRYCIQDTELLAKVWKWLDEHGFTRPGRLETAIEKLDKEVNRRGIPWDRTLASRMIAFEKRYQESKVQQARDASKGEIGLTKLRSPKALLKWLNEEGANLYGRPLYSITKGELKDALEYGVDLTEEVTSIIDARLAVARVASGKMRRGNASEVGGRLLHQLRYAKANTKRWTGAGVQPQNAPKGRLTVSETELILEYARDDTGYERITEWLRKVNESESLTLPPEKRRNLTFADVVTAMSRPCIRAPKGYSFAIVDLKSIEAYGIAWIARDMQTLKQYAAGLDPYKYFASLALRKGYDEVTSKERQLFKPIVLGCGYQLGAGRLGEYTAAFGVRLEDTGYSALDLVERYRDLNPLICGGRRKDYTPEPGTAIGRVGGLWKDAEAAAQTAVFSTMEAKTGRCTWIHNGDYLRIVLPSGGSLIYQRARIEEREDKFGRVKPQFLYEGHKGEEEFMYGGKWAENLTQAICRDLLCEGLLLAESAGLEIVFTVHDEAVALVKESEAGEGLAQLERCLSTSPDWALDFPVFVEGYTSPFYRK